MKSCENSNPKGQAHADHERSHSPQAAADRASCEGTSNGCAFDDRQCAERLAYSASGGKKLAGGRRSHDRRVSEAHFHERSNGPETGAESIKMCVQLGVLASEEPYRRMVQFRNYIVHHYEDVDPAILADIVNHHLGDFENFCREIRGYDLERNP